MPHPMLTLTALALIFAGTAALAQDTAPDDTTPVAEDAPVTDVPAVEAPAPEGFDLGTPVDGTGEELGQIYLRETFGDWNVQCLRVPEGEPEYCEMYQLLNGPDGNPVAELAILSLPPGGQAAAGARIGAPLETLLTEQLTISIDGANARRYPFSFCTAGGCIARIGFAAEEVAQFKAGGAAQMRLVPAAAPDQEMLLSISLTGFTAAFDSLAPVPN